MKNLSAKRRGRPPGRSKRGVETRQRLYETALRLFTRKGFEATTLREIADQAGVSLGLLYRYFPSKRAVVLALYDELSREFADRAAGMRPGRWHQRTLFVMKTSLQVLGPHRATLSALIPLLVSVGTEGVFSENTRLSRERVQEAFVSAVRDASDPPPKEMAVALGRLLYLAHLAILLWWLLERSPKQRTTRSLVALVEKMGPAAALALGLPGAREMVFLADQLVREAFFVVSEAKTAPTDGRKI